MANEPHPLAITILKDTWFKDESLEDTLKVLEDFGYEMTDNQVIHYWNLFSREWNQMFKDNNDGH